MEKYWLSLLIFAPLAGMLAVLMFGRTKEACRLISLVTTLVVAGLAAGTLVSYQGGSQQERMGVIGGHDIVTDKPFQSRLHVSGDWFAIGDLHVKYELDVDGFSMLLILLTAVIGVVAALASWNIDRAPRGYHSMLLLLVCAMLGTFAAMDFFLFYVFWELMLLPMYFLIGVWGGPRREYAAIKFFVYTLVGSVLILGAILALYFGSASVMGHGSLSIPELLENAPSLFHDNPGLRTVLFFAFFIGFAVKVPVWPFHTWLPDAHVEAPTPISVILAAVLLKMGGYGLIRVAWPMFPEVVRAQSGLLFSLALISIVYGAFVAWAQTDWKKLVAYSSVSHMGYVLLGLTALTAEGVSGAVFQMFNHGTISGMMFLLVGVMYDRVHHRDLNRFGGLLGLMPRYSVLAMIGFFAALGLPGMSGFVSEVMVFLGSFKSPMPHAKVFTVLSTLGVVFGAAYILTMIQKVFLGTPKEAGGHGDPGAAHAAVPDGHADPVAHDAGAHGGGGHGGGGHDVYVPPVSPWPDLTFREAATLLPLAGITIALGIWPSAALDLYRWTVEAFLLKMGATA